MPRTVVVTGARGFVGAATVRTLAGMADTRVVALARSRPAGDVDRHVRWVESSLEGLRPSQWETVLSSAPDAVLHLAAFTPKSAATRDCAPQIIDANIVGMQNLLSSFPDPPRRFVFCSTLDVYARQAFDSVVNEQSDVGPAGLYGASKLFGEGLAESYARSKGTEHLTLRLGHVFGPGEERYAKLVPETIRRVLAGSPPRLVGDGSERRDLLFVDDAAEALARACTVPLGDVRTINIARGESYAIAEIVSTIAGLAGFQGAAETLPRTAIGYSTAFDTSLMRRVLGSWTFVPLTEGLRLEIAHFRSTPS